MINVLFDCEHFTVAVKPAGLLSEEGEGSFPSLLTRELSLSALFPVHRLDRGVAGVMVYAKTKEAAALLSKENALKKTYLAVVKGVLSEKEGTLEDLLFKDAKKNKTFVVKSERKGVRKAALDYRVIKEREGFSLLSVTLKTGRSHQIRAQFSSRKHPIVGDGKYGGSDNAAKHIALFSSELSFCFSGQEYSFTALPSGEYPWDLFGFNGEKDLHRA